MGAEGAALAAVASELVPLIANLVILGRMIGPPIEAKPALGFCLLGLVMAAVIALVPTDAPLLQAVVGLVLLVAYAVAAIRFKLAPDPRHFFRRRDPAKESAA